MREADYSYIKKKIVEAYDAASKLTFEFYWTDGEGLRLVKNIQEAAVELLRYVDKKREEEK